MRVLVACVVALAATAANAATMSVTSVSRPVADPAGGIAAGSIANDILIDFEGRLGGQQIAVALTAGTVQNHNFGGQTAPGGGLLAFFPGLAGDTYLTMGGNSAETSAAVLLVGRAVNIPQAPASPGLLLGPNGVSAAFAPGTGVSILAGDDFKIAQLTLSANATGKFYIFSSVIGAQPFIEECDIVAGHIICIPEPSTAVLALLGLAGALRRRV